MELIDPSFDQLNISNFKAASAISAMISVSFYPDDSYSSEIKGLIDWTLFAQNLDLTQKQISTKSALARIEDANRNTDNILNNYKSGDVIYECKSENPTVIERTVKEILQNQVLYEPDTLYFRCDADSHYTHHTVDIWHVDIADIDLEYEIGG